MQPSEPRRIKGWIFDVYPSDFGKVAVWVISETGERVRLTDRFEPCIYVSGKQDDLERLISRLYANQKIASLKFTQKYAQPTDTEKSRVLEITVTAQKLQATGQPSHRSPTINQTRRRSVRGQQCKIPVYKFGTQTLRTQSESPAAYREKREPRHKKAPAYALFLGGQPFEFCRLHAPKNIRRR